MRLPKFTLSIRSKLLLLFILIALVPLLIENIIWFTVSRTQSLNNASTAVINVSNKTAEATNVFISNKINSLIIHSQTEAVRTQNIPDAVMEFAGYLKQDRDIEELILAGKNGKELVHVTQTKQFSQNELLDESNNPAFKAPNFGGGEKYISEVLAKNGSIKRDIIISIPVIIAHDLPNLNNLNTSEIGYLRTAKDISGVLIATINLNSYFKVLSSMKINTTGYVYLVDSAGNLIFHPDAAFMKQPRKLNKVQEVQLYLNSIPSSTQDAVSVNQSISETGKPVFSTFSHVLLTQWGVISEISQNDVFRSLIPLEIFGIVLFCIVFFITVILSLELSNNITVPIRLLREGAAYFGRGNFSYHVMVSSHDEFEELASTFNSMASDLQSAFEKLSIDKELIAIEKNKLQFIISNLTDAIIALDKQRTIILFNNIAEQITGYKAEEVIGKSITEIITLLENDSEIPADIYTPRSDTLSPLEEAKDSIFFKIKLALHSNRNKALFIRFTSLTLRKSFQELGYILTLHDLTEELNLEKMKIDFVSIAAHELRTPITIIRSYLSVFKKENEHVLTKNQNAYVYQIESAVERLVLLINNILGITRFENGSAHVTAQSTEWIPLVQKVINDLQNQAQNKGIAILLSEPKEQIDHVAADALRIQEVLINLIDNAIKYSKPGGKIFISIEQKDNMVITSIQDQGVGIPENAVHYLFSKFYRVESVLSKGTKGTGLGLYIAKSIVDLHKGELWVESVEGQGSTFRFSLPIIQPQNTEISANLQI